jgi:hypothetical protein
MQVHYRIQKIPSVEIILNEMNPFHLSHYIQDPFKYYFAIHDYITDPFKYYFAIHDYIFRMVLSLQVFIHNILDTFSFASACYIKASARPIYLRLIIRIIP